MSLSSLAQDSALRLSPDSVSLDQVVSEAAKVAAEAARGGALTAEEATDKGVVAAKKVDGGLTTVSSGPLAQLVKYVPTETVTLYIALQSALGELPLPGTGKISDADFSSRWLWMWIMFAATLLLAYGLSYRAQLDAQKNRRSKRIKKPVFEVLAAGAAFLIWALALPTTPLRDFEGFDVSAWNSVIILGGSLAIGAVAYIFGRTISWQKVPTGSTGDG